MVVLLQLALSQNLAKYKRNFKKTRNSPESELLPLELLESSLESELPDPEAAEDFVDFEDLFDTASTSGMVFTSFTPNWTVLKKMISKDGINVLY